MLLTIYLQLVGETYKDKRKDEEKERDDEGKPLSSRDTWGGGGQMLK